MAKSAEQLKRQLEKQLKKEQKLKKKLILDDKVIHDDLIFVLGNGTSRKVIEPDKLQKIAPVYGCNALYRSFSPDVLVAVDAKMIYEIADSGYQNNNQVWTNPNRSYQTIKNLNFFNPSKGWSSGPTALWFASQKNPQAIYILGFDYNGLDSGKKFNNVYANTKNYKSSRDAATFYGNWLRQTVTTIKEHPHIKYYRVIEHKGFIPKDFVNLSNLTHIYVHDFVEKFSL